MKHKSRKGGSGVDWIQWMALSSTTGLYRGRVWNDRKFAGSILDHDLAPSKQLLTYSWESTQPIKGPNLRCPTEEDAWWLSATNQDDPKFTKSEVRRFTLMFLVASSLYIPMVLAIPLRVHWLKGLPGYLHFRWFQPKTCSWSDQSGLGFFCFQGGTQLLLQPEQVPTESHPTHRGAFFGQATDKKAEQESCF